jgi:hypothetical protein
MSREYNEAGKHESSVFGYRDDTSRALRPRSVFPRKIRRRTLLPDICTFPYVSSLKDTQPTELH